METSKVTQRDSAILASRGVHVEIASRIADLQRQRQEKRRQRLAAEPGRRARLRLAGRLLSMARFFFS